MSTEKKELTSEEWIEIAMSAFEGAPISAAINFPQEHLEALYAVAYNHYKSKNIKDAIKLFKFLNMMDTMDPRFSMGYAACLQANEEYERAIEIYQVAMVGSALNDPSPMYYSAICYMKLNKKEEAIAALELAKHYSLEQHAHIHKQASDMLDIVNQMP